MPKQALTEFKSSFRGLNSAISPDLLQPDELSFMFNARIGPTAYIGNANARGAIHARPPTQRIHASAIGSGNPILGLFTWDGPSGKQLVAISNGRLYYTNGAISIPVTFTEVIPTAGDEFSTTVTTFFAPFRAASSGAPLILFMASGGKVYKWTGTTLTRIDGTNSVPAASYLAAYHTRMFYSGITTLPKHLFWSKVGDAENCSTGAASAGGSGMVDTLQGDAIKQIVVVGASLLIFTEDSIARLAGYSNNDIQIAQDTEGVSSGIGLRDPSAVSVVERGVMFVSIHGAYYATESGLVPIDADVENFFIQQVGITLADRWIVQFHPGDNEIWFLRKQQSSIAEVLIYATNKQAWIGSYSYPANAFIPGVLGAGTQANHSPNIMLSGGIDGFVRLMDTAPIASEDNVASDGTTAGDLFSTRVTLSPMFFGRPFEYKTLRRVHLQAYAATSPSQIIGVSVRLDQSLAETSDNMTTGLTAVGTVSVADGYVQSYRLDTPSVKGRRPALQLNFASGTVDKHAAIHGVLVEAFTTGRV